MTTVESEILKCLRDVEAGVAAIRTAAPKPNLLPLFARLDELSGSLPAGSHGQLIHYLRNKSYQKARLWLEGRESETARGTCGGR